MKHWRELTINLIFSHTCMKLCALGLDVHARTVNYQLIVIFSDFIPLLLGKFWNTIAYSDETSIFAE